MNSDKKSIRRKQRLKNYQKGLSQLQKFIDKGNLSELEKLGLIKAFEYTYELGWNSLKGEKLTLFLLNAICNDLDELLLPYTFDLSINEHISNPDLIEHIERVGISFYKRDMVAI